MQKDNGLGPLFHTLDKNQLRRDHRQPQLDTTQTSTDYGSLAPTNTATTQLLHLWFQEHQGRESRMIVRDRIPKSLMKSLSWKQDRTTEVPVDMLIWKGENLMEIFLTLDKELHTTNDCWEG